MRRRRFTRKSDGEIAVSVVGWFVGVAIGITIIITVFAGCIKWVIWMCK